MSEITKAILSSDTYQSGRKFTVKDLNRETRIEPTTLRSALHTLDLRGQVAREASHTGVTYWKPQKHWIHGRRLA